MKKYIKNTLSLSIGLLLGFYTGQYFPDLYFVEIKQWIPTL